MEKEKILEFAKNEGYAKINYLGKWKEYDVYDLIMEEEINGEEENCCVGYPYVLLVKENEIRVSEPMECLRVRRQLIKDEE